jgi:hypothetical protein
VSYFRPQKSEKPARGASAASRIQLRNCLEKGVGSNPLGELIKITYPKGGYTRYDYGIFDVLWDDSVSLHCDHASMREVTAKHECRQPSGTCGTEDTTTYQPAVTNGSRANVATDVFSPDLSGVPNKTHYVFGGFVSPDYAARETDRYIYSGSATLLRTIHTDYSPAVSTDAAGMHNYSQPIRVTTTLNDGAGLPQSKVETDFDSITVTWQGATQSFPIDNPTEIREFDFDGTVKRKTDYTWLQGENTISRKSIF